MKLRLIVILLALIVIIGLLAYQVEIAFAVTPSVASTWTRLTQPTPQEIGSFDVLGYQIDKQRARRLKQTEEGQALLLPENGAVEVTEDLLNLGRKAFYGETFKNEIFLTDVVGVLDGPINLMKSVRNHPALQP
jgi:ABC-type phosphate transport system auxiliary subunit